LAAAEAQISEVFKTSEISAAAESRVQANRSMPKKKLASPREARNNRLQRANKHYWRA